MAFILDGHGDNATQSQVERHNDEKARVRAAADHSEDIVSPFHGGAVPMM